MKKRTMSTFLILLVVFSIISFSFFLREKSILKHEYNLKMNLKTTDLSTILINGHKLGETLTNVDERIFLIYCENGKTFGSYSSREKIEDGCIIKRISAFFKEGTEITYKGEIFTTFSELKNKLGNNYIKGLPNLDETNTITYVDQVNNIELIFSDVIYEENNDIDIDVKRIEDNAYRIAATPTLKYNQDPLNVIFSLAHTQKSNYLFNTLDYLTMPLYFTLFLLPIILFLLEKEKSIRKKLLIVNICLFIAYLILWLSFWFSIMMSV